MKSKVLVPTGSNSYTGRGSLVTGRGSLVTVQLLSTLLTVVGDRVNSKGYFPFCSLKAPID